MAELSDVTARFTVPGRVAFDASPLGGPLVRLASGDQQALVAVHGAQVLNWTKGGAGLLWLSPIARIREGKSIRGGIPVCWPWFGDHPDGGGRPAHGFVRQRAWEVVGGGLEDDAAYVTLATATRPEDRSWWPFEAAVRLTVALGASGLNLTLATRNTGKAAFALTEALHTYFRVADIADVEVTGLDAIDYLDKPANFARLTQSGGIAFADEVDRIYCGPSDDTPRRDLGPITLIDRGASRRIVITGRGSRSAVVWNPGPEKTARLGDMGSPDAYRQMVCIETANAGDDIVTLLPGAEHELAVTYRLEP